MFLFWMRGKSVSYINRITDFDQKNTDALRIEPQEGSLFKLAAIIAHSGDSWLWCGILFYCGCFLPETENVSLRIGAVLLR